MTREEIIFAIKTNVAKCNGMCFVEDLWINNSDNGEGEDFEVDHVEADRVVVADDYYTFDELSDEELQRVLDSVDEVANDLSETSTDELYAMVCKECDVETVLDNAENYIEDIEIRNFLLACLGKEI